MDGLHAVLVGGSAVLVATGEATIGTLGGCAFLLATVGTLFDASAFAMLPGVVPADRLAAVNGRLQVGATMAGGFVGATMAGVLFAVAAALPFAVDAVTFAAAALLALTLRPVPPPVSRPDRRPAWRAAAVVDPFGNVLGVMHNQRYLDVLAAGRAA